MNYTRKRRRDGWLLASVKFIHTGPPMASKATVALLIVAAVLVATASPRLLGLLGNTALLTLGTLAIALPLGTLLGLFIAKTDLPGRGFAAWLCIGMLFVPLYVQAAAWSAVIGPGGWLTQWLVGDGYTNAWLTGWRAAVWVHAMAAVPWAALLAAASLATVERRLEEESLLDASPLRVLWRVSLRRGAGGVWAAAVWIAVVCATEIAVTDLYQIRTFAEEIYTQASLGPLAGSPQALLGTELATGVALVALLVALLLRLMAPWLPKAASIDADATWKWRPAAARWLAAGAAWSLLAAATLIPLAGLAWRAGVEVRQLGGQYVRGWSWTKAAAMALHSPWEQRREWGWSLAIGALAAALSLAAGASAAWGVRVRPKLARPFAAGIVLLLAVPGPLLGVWLIAAMNRPADHPWGFLTTLYDRTLVAPVIVQFLRALPLVALWLWSQFTSIPQDVLDAARSEGAGRCSLLTRIGLPLRRGGILVGLLIGLVLSVGEVTATLLVTPPGVTTVSVRVFQLLHYGVDDRVAGVALSIFAVLAGLLLVASTIYRRSGPRGGA